MAYAEATRRACLTMQPNVPQLCTAEVCTMAVSHPRPRLCGPPGLGTRPAMRKRALRQRAARYKRAGLKLGISNMDDCHSTLPLSTDAVVDVLLGGAGGTREETHDNTYGTEGVLPFSGVGHCEESDDSSEELVRLPREEFEDDPFCRARIERTTDGQTLTGRVLAIDRDVKNRRASLPDSL